MKQRCTFCKRPDHTEDKCYRKHGYPVGHPLHKANTAVVAKLDIACAINDDNTFAAFTTTIDGPLNKCDRLIDSGASTHYCNNRDWFQSFKSIPVRNIILGDNRVIHATGCGNVPIKLVLNGKVIIGVIQYDFYVPDIGANLLSVYRLAQSGLDVSVNGNYCLISDKAGKLLARGVKGEGSLYRLSAQPTRTIPMLPMLVNVVLTLTVVLIWL